MIAAFASILLLVMLATCNSQIDDDPHLCSQPPLGTPEAACRAACTASRGSRFEGDETRLVLMVDYETTLSGECVREDGVRLCRCHLLELV